MFIYLIVNHITGKYYVGQHKGNNLKKYLQQKLWEAEHRLSARSYLYASMRKYGREAFTIHALLSDIQTREELDQKEKEFIAFLRSTDPEYGYNICRGGEGFTGPHSQISKEKNRDNSLQTWRDPIIRERRIKNQKQARAERGGSFLTKDSIEKIKAARAEQDEATRLAAWGENKGAAEGKQNIAPDGTAWCCGCQAYKLTDIFSKDVRRPNGLAPYCRTCNHARKGYSSTRGTPRKFSAEFKSAAIARLQSEPLAEVARSINVAERLLRKWRQTVLN